MKELYYYKYINERIIKKYNYKKYESNLKLFERYIKHYKFNNQIVTINNKNYKLKDYIKIVNKFLNKLRFNNFNSCSYVTYIYLKDNINYIDNNYKLSNKQINKYCLNIHNTILESYNIDYLKDVDIYER